MVQFMVCGKDSWGNSGLNGGSSYLTSPSCQKYDDHSLIICYLEVWGIGWVIEHSSSFSHCWRQHR